MLKFGCLPAAPWPLHQRQHAPQARSGVRAAGKMSVRPPHYYANTWRLSLLALTDNAWSFTPHSEIKCILDAGQVDHDGRFTIA